MKKSKLLKRISVFVCIIMVMMIPLQSFAADIDGHWSKEYVLKAADNKWMVGDGNGNYSPEEAMTRGDFALIVWRALGSHEPKAASPFTDVTSADYYAKAIASLFEDGYVTGLSETTFGPKDTMTREMAFSIVTRAFKLSPKDANSYKFFADHEKVSSWAKEPISALYEKGFVKGNGVTVFPQNMIKRGEAAKVLVMLIEQITGQGEGKAAINLSLNPASTTASSVTVTASVTAPDKDTSITFVGYRTSSQNAIYTSKDGFTDITSTKQFQATANGWYAVCAVDSNGVFTYKLIEVTNVAASSGGGSSSTPSALSQLNSAAAVNWDGSNETTLTNLFTKAGIKGINTDSLEKAKDNIAAVRAAKGSSLTKEEMQTAVYVVFADFGRSIVTAFDPEPSFADGYTFGFYLNEAALTTTTAYDQIRSFKVNLYDGTTKISEVQSTRTETAAIANPDQVKTYTDIAQTTDGYLNIVTRTEYCLDLFFTENVGGFVKDGSVYVNSYLRNTTPCPDVYGKGENVIKTPTKAVLTITLEDNTALTLTHNIGTEFDSEPIDVLNAIIAQDWPSVSPYNTDAGLLQLFTDAGIEGVTANGLDEAKASLSNQSSRKDIYEGSPLTKAEIQTAVFVASEDFSIGGSGDGYSIGYNFNLDNISYDDIKSFTVQLFDGASPISKVTAERKSWPSNPDAGLGLYISDDTLLHGSPTGQNSIVTRTATFLQGYVDLGTGIVIENSDNLYESAYLVNDIPCPSGASPTRAVFEIELETPLTDGTTTLAVTYYWG